MQQKRVEVAANRCSRKIPFQKVLEIQQENTFGGVLFQAEGCNIIKTELHHQFSNFSEDFQNTFSIEHRQTAASKTVKQFKPHAKANKHGTGICAVCLKKKIDRNLYALSSVRILLQMQNKHYKIARTINDNRNINQEPLKFNLT